MESGVFGAPRHAHEDDVGVLQAARADAVVEPHGELDRLDALEVARVEDGLASRSHRRRLARDPRHGVDRVAEEIAVVEPVAPAQRAHRIPELVLDERVHEDRAPPARPCRR